MVPAQFNYMLNFTPELIYFLISGTFRKSRGELQWRGAVGYKFSEVYNFSGQRWQKEEEKGLRVEQER